MLSISAEKHFLEHLLVITEDCNDFDIPYYYLNVSDVLTFS